MLNVKFEGVKIMNYLKIVSKFIGILFIVVFSFYLAGCNQNTSSVNETDDQFLESVVKNGTNSNWQEDEDIMANESYDLDNGGAVSNGGGFDTPIDSLLKWGRKINSVNVQFTMTSEGDTVKNVVITRTISGNFIIIGIVNNVMDTVIKPYTEVLHRNVSFKRVARSGNPRYNWRLYKVSMLDGETTLPQKGTDYVQMNKLEVYVNGTLKYTFNGPDFTQNIFTTRKFGGSGIPEVNVGDQVKMRVYLSSTQSERDIVAWHWARNAFGFHRVPFDMVSETPNAHGYDRIFEKTYNIYNDHKRGCFNGYISASTHKSLFDDSPLEFASDLLGTPYRVLP